MAALSVDSNVTVLEKRVLPGFAAGTCGAEPTKESVTRGLDPRKATIGPRSPFSAICTISLDARWPTLKSRCLPVWVATAAGVNA